MTIKKKTVEEVGSPNSYVVGVGASAGGLEAINEFFENTPVNTGYLFIRRILYHAP